MIKFRIDGPSEFFVSGKTFPFRIVTNIDDRDVMYEYGRSKYEANMALREAKQNLRGLT